MFTPSEIEQFRSEGWVAKDEFWRQREARAMRRELERLKAGGLEEHGVVVAGSWEREVEAVLGETQ